MGVIGGLFAKHNTFQAQGPTVNQGHLAGYGYGTTNVTPNIGQGMDQSNQADAGQADLANQLALRAAGKAGPSIAEQQLSQSLGQVQQQGAGSMAAARGVSPGTAARLIGANQTNAAQQAAGQGAIMRSQEQQAAEGALANVLAQRRQGALGQSQVAGGIQQGQNQTAAGLEQANMQGAMDAQHINSGVAAANTAADNATGMGMLNAAGSAMALAGGGEVPDSDGGEGAGGYAAGGEVSLAHALMHSHKHLSSAHEALAKYAAGGEVHNSYSYPAMDLTSGKKPTSKVQYIPHDYKPDSTPSQGKEGTDSEGNAKPSINRAHGGEIAPLNVRDAAEHERVSLPAEDDESPTQARLRKRDEARETNKATQTANDMRSMEEATPHYAGGGLIGKGIHALGQALGIGENDAVHAGNTEGGKTYSMDTSDAYHPVYGQGSTFGADAGDESDTRGANFQAPTPPPPSSLMPGHPMATPGQMATPGFGLPMKSGGPVPGQAHVRGDSLKNDTVPAMLSPGEVVLPRTVSHDPEAASEFVRHINARKMASGGEVKGYGAVLNKQRELHQRLSALEQRLGRK